MTEFESIYEQICGLRADGVKYANEFKKGGACTELSQKAFSVRARLEERLNSFEDEDVLSLVDCYEEMQKLVAYKIWLYARA